jgi:heat shock protein HtpX
MPLTDYAGTSSDWRRQLQRNERKTRNVILVFIFVYVVVGLIVDIFILQSRYPGGNIGQYLHALLTFKAVPYATLIMGGIAGVSLLITYSMYDKIMLLGTEYHEVTPETAQTIQEKQLYNVVDEMRVAAGLRFMPRIFIIEAQYMNAFASGYSEKSAMVAITRGLMEKLDRAELQAVMAHECNRHVVL